MTHRAPLRWKRVILALTLVATAVVTVSALCLQLPGSSDRAIATQTQSTPERVITVDDGTAIDVDGVLPDDATAFDDEHPGVANLNADLRDALRGAAQTAEREGVTLTIISGWRSSAYQTRLLEDAIATYGTAEEAARWVATPSTSAHVTGDAVDVDADDAAWLSRHGAEYGLCQIYENEPWHFELRADARDRGCPAMYADPTRDPRMQQ